VNRQIAIVDSKYVGKIYPLRTGHVIRRMRTGEISNKLDCRRRERDRLGVAKFSKCRVWDTVLEGNTVTVGETTISL